MLKISVKYNLERMVTVTEEHRTYLGSIPNSRLFKILKLITYSIFDNLNLILLNAI